MSRTSQHTGDDKQGEAQLLSDLPPSVLPGDPGIRPEQLVELPRKLEIPPNLEDRFERLREKITTRIQSLGAPTKVSDALLCLLLEINEGVIRPGFLGNQRLEFAERMNRLFGDGNWSTQHLLKGRLLPHETALKYYEDAYVVYFKKNPDKLEWLTTNYSDVVDNSPTNVQSRFDYTKQEIPEKGYHIHDIAIRKAVHRLGGVFTGEEVLTVRGKYKNGGIAPGYFLSPGEVGFHKLELIPPEPFVGRNPWWQPETIEHFYQATRRLVVDEFASDAPFPTEALQSQQRESYLHRVAARMTLRTLLLMTQSQVSLTEFSHLPWMMDYGSFPLNEYGLPRQFSNEETEKILSSACEQLDALLRKTGSKDEYLLEENGWLSFDRTKPFLDAVTAAHHSSLSEDQVANFPDVVEREAWSRVLPLFEQHFRENKDTARPLFLARDGLAIMEYLTYAKLIEGSSRADANTELQKPIYLPGAPDEHTSKNSRRAHPLFDATTAEIKRIACECRQELGINTAPVGAELRQRVNRLFEEKTHALLARWRNNEEVAHGPPGNTLYEWWFDAYRSIRDSFENSPGRITIVDSDGTGKTALFIRSVLTFFAHERAEPVSVDILLGALQPNHLGVPSLLEQHSLQGAVPDIRWPFRFDSFENEPVFNAKKTPTNVLTLLYRSISFYNTAVRAFEERQVEDT